MSSPNEPGHPSPGDSPGNGNGPVDRGANRPGPAPSAGRLTDSGDVPPWQRGAATRSRQAAPTHAPTDPPTRQERAESRPAGHSPGVDARLDARLNRFVTGTAAPNLGSSAPPAPAPEQEPAAGRPEGPRTEVARTEAYASELPDLSGPTPRPTQQRKTAVERTAIEAPATTTGAARPAGNLGSRVQVSNRSRGPVRASMQIRRIDPWSALKVSLLLSVALFFVWMIAVAFLYLVLGGMGVWSKLNSNVGDLLTNTSSGELVSSGTIFGGAALIGLVNIVLLTAMATVGAFIYNLTTDLVGGIEVTLADRD